MDAVANQSWTFIVLVIQSRPFTSAAAILVGGVIPMYVHAVYDTRRGIFKSGVEMTMGMLASGMADVAGRYGRGEGRVDGPPATGDV